MTPPRQWVLAVELDDAHAAALQRVLPPDVALERATASSWTAQAAGGPVCVLVDATQTSTSVADWLQMVETRLGLPLVALVASEAEATRWLRAGTSDCVFAHALEGITLALARLERDAAVRHRRDERERMLHEGTQALLHLARSREGVGDLEASLRAITEVATRGLDTARAGVWLFSPDGATLRAADLFDARAQEHSSGQELISGEYPRYFAALHEARLLPVTLAQSDPRTSEFRDGYFAPEGVVSTIDAAVRLRGEEKGCICIEHRGQPRRWSPEEQLFVVTLAEAVALALESAERLRAEAALAQNEQRFRDFFRFTKDFVVLYRVQPDGVVVIEDLNPAAEKLSGLVRERVIGKRLSEVLGPAEAAALEQRQAECIRTKVPISYDSHLGQAQGPRSIATWLMPLVDERGTVRGLAAMARDVTTERETRLLEQELSRRVAEAEKAEVLARVTAHIAEDVNNLLDLITTQAARIEGEARVTHAAQSILQTTSRGRELTQQVMMYSRRRSAERRSIDLGSLVRETVGLLQPSARSAALEVHVAPGANMVLGDVSQLRHALTNLVTNGVAGMPDGGVVRVTLQPVEVDAAAAAKHPGLAPGRWLRLTVADSGAGLDASAAARVFEPFAVRADGRTMGLGMAVVQSVVTAHEGRIVVDSERGRGTSFHVYLRPFVEDASRPGAGHRLLVVDDHPGMARVSAKLLETLGYRTTVFDDPRLALEAFRVAPNDFDAVLTDFSMPQMSGAELTRSLRSVRPGLPIIVSSGLASELNSDQLQTLGIDGVLLKPWRLEEAVATLNRAMRAHGVDAP